MFKRLSIFRILSIVVLLSLIIGMMGKGALPDILHYLVSLAFYSFGTLIIIWAVTQGFKKKKTPKDKDQDSENK